jgi:hypothetical protein
MPVAYESRAAETAGSSQLCRLASELVNLARRVRFSGGSQGGCSPGPTIL